MSPSKWVILVLVIALSGAMAWVFKERAAVASVRATFETFKREVADKRAATLARYRALEKLRQEARDETERVRLAGQAEVARVSASFSRARADARSLRKQLDEYARGRAGADDTLAACHGRAATLGEFVDDGLRVQEALAERAESCAVDLRSLRAFWRSVSPGEVRPGAE